MVKETIKYIGFDDQEREEEHRQPGSCAVHGGQKQTGSRIDRKRKQRAEKERGRDRTERKRKHHAQKQRAEQPHVLRTPGQGFGRPAAERRQRQQSEKNHPDEDENWPEQLAHRELEHRRDARRGQDAGREQNAEYDVRQNPAQRVQDSRKEDLPRMCDPSGEKRDRRDVRRQGARADGCQKSEPERRRDAEPEGAHRFTDPASSPLRKASVSVRI